MCQETILGNIQTVFLAMVRDSGDTNQGGKGRFV